MSSQSPPPPASESFWRRFQSGVKVAVTSSQADKLLGVRDAFQRYFHDGLAEPIPISVLARSEVEDSSFFPLSDEEILAQASKAARQLRDRLGEAYDFYVSPEVGLQALEVEGRCHYFVRVWTVLCGPPGEAWGGSGSVQLPDSLIERLDSGHIPFAIPGTRRRGGMISSLTGGIETRRSAVATSAFHALATLYYDILESRPGRRRGPRRYPH